MSHSVMSDSLRTHELQHARPPCPSPTPRVHWDSCPLSQWCHPTISSSVTSFSSCPQSFPTSGSFPMRWLFPSGSKSIGALASVLPLNIKGWFPLGLTGLITLHSKGFSRVFSNTTAQKHQFFSAQPSLRRRQQHPTPVLLPGKSHGRRSLVGCSPWGREESGTTERLHFDFSLSCIGEGNGNPLQCSCLENPRDGSLVGCRLWGRTESDTTDLT